MFNVEWTNLICDVTALFHLEAKQEDEAVSTVPAVVQPDRRRQTFQVRLLIRSHHSPNCLAGASPSILLRRSSPSFAEQGIRLT